MIDMKVILFAGGSDTRLTPSLGGGDQKIASLKKLIIKGTKSELTAPNLAILMIFLNLK